MSSSFQHMYKRKGAVLDEIKFRNREEFQKTKKENRAKLLLGKRYKFDEILVLEKMGEITVEDVKNWTCSLRSKQISHKRHLQLLRKAFASGVAYIDAFFSVSDGLWNLVGFLSRSGLEQQLESCWCFTNISAVGSRSHVMKVVKAAAPYLVTYLTGDNAKLQTQCAWALGNMAADGEKTRAVLVAQGIVQPLIDLLKQTEEDSLIEAVSFALSNLMPSHEDRLDDIVKKGLLQSIKRQLDREDAAVPVVAELSWLLLHFTTDPVLIRMCHQSGLIGGVAAWLDHLCKTDTADSVFYAVTPLQRIIGNVCSQPDTCNQMMEETPFLLDTITGLLNSDIDHLAKECLWLLGNLSASAAMPAHQHVLRGIVPKVMQCMTRNRDIQKEVAICLCNICAVDCLALDTCLECGLLDALSKWFHQLDGELISYALKLSELLLRQRSGGRELFSQAGGQNMLASIAQTEHQLIGKMASDLLSIYYLGDKT